MGPVRHRVDSLHRIDPRSLERGITPLVNEIMYINEEVLPEPSRETKFSGVHKDSWVVRGLGARALASPSRTVLKKL